jgi:nucleoside-diphosphate-sugar epimerase
MILALTGATGFVGRHVLDQALAVGHQVRALTRRPQPSRDGVTWVEGALDRPDALMTLVSPADVVLHIAGVVSAPDRATFERGNVRGTQEVLDAAHFCDVHRLVHVSSLAAREPALSLYGWSKAEAERLVQSSPLGWSIVRPPAVFGPGDLEMLDLFRAARRGIAPVPAGRFSVIAVEDLAALLLALAQAPADRTLYEVDDGGHGYTHSQFAHALGHAVGRRVTTLPVPGPLLSLAAHADRLWRGPKAKLTPDRAAYIRHPDWTVDPARRPPPDLWRPRRPTPEALAATARWYREQGLL